MSGGQPKNLAISVRDRLRNRARETKEDFQRTLTRYGIERLLFRLANTEGAERYVLKGAMLFVTWPKHVFRPTGDVDFLGHGDPDPEAIKALFVRVCAAEVPDDGMIFDPATVDVQAVREEEAYSGVAVRLTGRLDTTQIRVLIDIGFGDHVHPDPIRRVFPVLLDGIPAPDLLMYPPETVVAEKFEAMLRFGTANGRVKDFHDIWVTTQTFDFDLAELTAAVSGTLKRRDTAMPTEIPAGLTQTYADVVKERGLWTGFLRRNPPTSAPPPFEDLQAELWRFLRPVIDALALPEAARGRWNPQTGAWG